MSFLIALGFLSVFLRKHWQEYRFRKTQTVSWRYNTWRKSPFAWSVFTDKDKITWLIVWLIAAYLDMAYIIWGLLKVITTAKTHNVNP